LIWQTGCEDFEDVGSANGYPAILTTGFFPGQCPYMRSGATRSPSMCVV
jgi:hypothetical protein